MAMRNIFCSRIETESSILAFIASLLTPRGLSERCWEPSYTYTDSHRWKQQRHIDLRPVFSLCGRWPKTSSLSIVRSRGIAEQR